MQRSLCGWFGLTALFSQNSFRFKIITWIFRFSFVEILSIGETILEAYNKNMPSTTTTIEFLIKWNWFWSKTIATIESMLYSSSAFGFDDHCWLIYWEFRRLRQKRSVCCMFFRRTETSFFSFDEKKWSNHTHHSTWWIWIVVIGSATSMEAFEIPFSNEISNSVSS